MPNWTFFSSLPSRFWARSPPPPRWFLHHGPLSFLSTQDMIRRFALGLRTLAGAVPVPLPESHDVALHLSATSLAMQHRSVPPCDEVTSAHFCGSLVATDPMKSKKNKFFRIETAFNSVAADFPCFFAFQKFLLRGPVPGSFPELVDNFSTHYAPPWGCQFYVSTSTPGRSPELISGYPWLG